MTNHRGVLQTDALQRRSAVLRRYPLGSKVRYTSDGRTGEVLDVDTEAKRLLLKRAEVREGEWERVAVPLAQIGGPETDALPLRAVG